MIPNEFFNIARLEHAHWWYAGMAAIARDWLKPATANSCGRLLDAGCGTGGNLGWLSQFGRAYGLDLHPGALHLAQTHGGQPLVCADVQALPFAAAQFNIVTSFDVLYHSSVASDRDALREMARVLRPGGWLLLRMPAYNWLRGAHDRAVHTRHRYSSQEIHAKLLAAGLRPVRLTYANALLLLPAIAWRAIQSVTGQPAASDVRMPPRPINRFLTALLRAEAAWLRHFNLPAGLSVLALAQKELQ